MALKRTRNGWILRLRYGKGQRGRFHIPVLSGDPVEDERLATDRARRLEEISSRLGRAGKHVEAAVALSDGAAAASEQEFSAIERAALLLAAEAGSAARPKVPKTFRDMCELWLTGEIHRQFPDRVAERQARTDARDRYRLGRICETVGEIPLAKFDRKAAERALAALPRHLMGSTRSKYAALIPRVMRLAELAGFIDRSPLPSGWAPGAGEGREFQFIYPEEDQILMGCRSVPLERRLLWGFLVREGLRVSEALALVWNDIDLDRRSIIVRKSKTGRMRRWRLGEDVARALSDEQQRTGAGGNARVFVQLKYRTAITFRDDLNLCQLKRRELHEGTAESRHVTVHDLRGSFVTMCLASGWPEQRIMDRTGHRTSKMLHVYDRASRFARDHEMAWYGPLNELLRVGHPIDGEAESLGKEIEGPGKDWTQNSTDSRRSGTFQAEPVGLDPDPKGAGPSQYPQGGPHESPVEIALAAALEAATKAQRWDVVLEVTRELSERRRARTQPDVPSLDAARKKRDEGGK